MKKFVFLLILTAPAILFAQENYEIQVYASPTMTKGGTIFELHSNFTFSGEKNIKDGVRPSYHALHETVEITHGVAENFEIGFYLFTNYTPGYGFRVIGTHIRPRITVPEKWNWPFGASLSAELGLQSKKYSADTKSLEIRPILDKQFKNLYLSFNPVFSIGLEGINTDHTPSFAPNMKASYTIKKTAIGIEYYGDIGQLDQSLALKEQAHAFFLTADIFTGPKWEINFGPGLGLTPSTDRFVFKLLVGRRISGRKK